MKSGFSPIKRASIFQIYQSFSFMDASNTNSGQTQAFNNIEEAVSILTQTYGEMAGEEILLRALYSHRNMDYENALFWMDVYEKIYPENPNQYF